MRTIVTGGAGFIGSHIAECLVARGDEVVVVDDLSTGLERNVPAGARFQRLDISAGRSDTAIAVLRADAVVHCAAQPSVSASFRDPARDARVNVVGGVNAILGAIAGGARRFIYVNTGGALYGQPARIPTSEDEPAAPSSPYGLSKSVLEAYLALLAPARGWWASLRLANVYGPRQRPDGEAGVVSIFCDRMLHGLPVEIHGDGLQTRDFIYVGDVVDAVVAALDGPEHLVLNVGTGSATSVRDLFVLLADLTDYRSPAVYMPPRSGDVRESALDPARARAALGWTPRSSLSEGLRRTVEWHRMRADDRRDVS